MRCAPIFVLGSFVISCSAKVAHFPQAGESLKADCVTIEAGGKGFNLALGIGRLGVAVDGLFAVGDDLLAGFAEPAFARAELEPAMLRRVPGKTGSGIGFTDESGENCLAVDPGVNYAWSDAAVPAAASRIEAAAMTLAQFEIADAPILAGFAIARAAKRRTLLNPSPFRTPSRELLALTSILVVNASEATALAAALLPGRDLKLDAGPDPALADFASALFESGPDMLVVTLGAAGAVILQADGPTLRQGAFAVDTVDTLGAGDAFTAGFAAALVDGRELAEALRRACACGALSTRRMGVFEALPTLAELERLLSPQS